MSMHWAALLTDAASEQSLPIDPLGVAVWALQYTPRVARLDQAVLLEVDQSLRLFHGEDNLHQLIEAGAGELGVERLAWAPTSLAALACARLGIRDGFAGPLNAVLDPLPLGCIDAICVFRGNLATHSGPNQPPVPAQCGPSVPVESEPAITVQSGRLVSSHSHSSERCE